MLEEAFAALAAAGGTAVVQAAGTDTWEGIRHKVAKLFGRNDQRREQSELERLNQTMVMLQRADHTKLEEVRIRQEASWQARIEALLESLATGERQEAAAELQAIINNYSTLLVPPSSGPGSLTAGQNVNIHAYGGSIAGGVINGDVTLTSPRKPDPAQG